MHVIAQRQWEDQYDARPRNFTSPRNQRLPTWIRFSSPLPASRFTAGAAGS
jgi:hypothetical protein